MLSNKDLFIICYQLERVPCGPQVLGRGAIIFPTSCGCEIVQLHFSPIRNRVLPCVAVGLGVSGVTSRIWTLGQWLPGTAQV